MSGIEGPKGVGAARRVGRAEPVEGRAVAEAGGVTEAAPSDPVLGLLDRIANDLAAAGVTERGEAVRGLVDEILTTQMPHLEGPARQALAADVAASMLANPDLTARLDRILRPAS